jgi:hypothetical protein
MFSKKELKLAYGVAVCLLVIGAISYAAFPLQAPEEPLRLMYTVAAGNVLFVMILKRGMKKCPNEGMLFISSVRVATRIMKPVL